MLEVHELAHGDVVKQLLLPQVCVPIHIMWGRLSASLVFVRLPDIRHTPPGYSGERVRVVFWVL